MICSKIKRKHCVKSVHVRSYSGPYYLAFGLNAERYSISLPNQSECGKIRTRITPNTDTFHLLYETLCEIWYHLFNFNLKNVKLLLTVYNVTKSNTPPCADGAKSRNAARIW